MTRPPSLHTSVPAAPESRPGPDASDPGGEDGDRQTFVDGRARNPPPYLEAAVDLLRREKVTRVLVLDRGDSAAAVRLHCEGLDVVCVDGGSQAAGLARAVLRAPGLEMVITHPAAFAAQARSESFDAMFADLQDETGPPPVYLSAAFWEDVKRLLRRGGLVLVNVTDELHAVRAWGPFQRALAAAGFTAMVLRERQACGNRLLVTSRAR